MSIMHDIRDYRIKDYVKILLILLVMSGFINIVAAAPSLSNSGGGSWQYYKEITIRENSGSLLTDYQIPISISSNNFPTNGMSDGADIRFTDSNGNELSYWIESWDNVNSKAKIWVKVSSIPANSNTIIRMYYGNPSAVSASQPKQTMLIYEDMQTQPSGTLSGNAVYDATNKWVQLTSLSANAQKGYLYYLMNPGNGFVASFEFWSNNEKIEGYNTYGAIVGSTWLGAYDSTYSGSEDVTAGGYHFTFDEYQQRIAFTKSTSIDGVPISSASATNIANSQWHRAKIYFLGTTAKIYYDDSLKVDSVDTTYKSDKSGNYYIFGGGNVYHSSGVQVYNEHRIRNIIVSKYTSPEPTLLFSIEQPITTPTPTTPAPTTPVPTTPVPTTPVPTLTSIPTVKMTTPQDVQNSKVAVLQVVYNVGRKDNGVEVTVTLKNVGSSTARFVNLSMNIPTELDAILDSGAEMDGNTMVWKGDIEPGKEHVIKYHVKPAKTDIEIPVKVTYINSEKTLNKVMAKASAEGMSVSAIQIDPQDLQTIQILIQIAKSLLPGFEIVLAIVGIGVIYAIRKINR